MRKIALYVASALLITSNAFAGNAVLDFTAMAKAILNPPKTSLPSESGRFAIVYGGQDISRDASRYDRPVQVG
jgi:hypothetical protein